MEILSPFPELRGFFFFFQARVLFNLQYLDDAIFLTRRSLEVQPPDQNAWQQHFQLGEILKVTLG
jgi:hypothetical protein